MGDLFLGDILQKVYLPFKSKAFPVNMTMGNAIGGIGSLLGVAAATGQEYYRTGVQAQFVNKLKKELKKEELKKELPPLLTDSDWLTAKVDRVRYLGQDWLNGKRIGNRLPEARKAPPATSGTAQSWEGSGIPTKRLPNGDLMYVYPEGYYVPDEVLNKWKEQNARNAYTESKW